MRNEEPIVHGTDGTQWMHRWLMALVRRVGVRPLYAVMAVLVVPGYVLFRRKAFMAIWHYMRRRQGFGRWRSLRLTLLNHYRFGQVVIDRFAMYAGLTFRLDRPDDRPFQELCARDEGFVVMSCHAGSYEMCGYTFAPDKKACSVVVYGGESASVKANRQRIFGEHNIRMIPVADDMSHIFLMNNALAEGQIVSIPADRVFGSPRTVDCRLLGAKARLPLGPFALATQRGVKALAIFVMKESAYRYTVHERPIEAGSEAPGALAQAFATEMEKMLRQYPEQWFNYYEFWADDD